MKKVKIMDISFINETKDMFFTNHIQASVEKNKKKFIVTANPEILMKTREDKAYKKIVQSADYVVPDGIGVVWTAKRHKTPIKERIPGVELMEVMLEYANENKKTCYFLGSEKIVNKALINKVTNKYPDMIIGGSHHGFFDLDDSSIVEGVKQSDPDFIFVALGFPRQENWINKHFDTFNKGIFMGVGGSFDVLSGLVERAPKIWIKLNLEWLYRIVKQPSRVGRIFVVMKFMLLVLLKR